MSIADRIAWQNACIRCEAAIKAVDPTAEFHASYRTGFYEITCKIELRAAVEEAFNKVRPASSEPPTDL